MFSHISQTLLKCRHLCIPFSHPLWLQPRNRLFQLRPSIAERQNHPAVPSARRVDLGLGVAPIALDLVLLRRRGRVRHSQPDVVGGADGRPGRHDRRSQISWEEFRNGCGGRDGIDGHIGERKARAQGTNETDQLGEE